MSLVGDEEQREICGRNIFGTMRLNYEQVAIIRNQDQVVPVSKSSGKDFGMSGTEKANLVHRESQWFIKVITWVSVWLVCGR